MASPSPASEEFLTAFRRRAGAAGALPFDAFMELALYDPAVGYYRRPRPRVGTGGGTDFVTSASAGPLFGELVLAACLGLLGERNPREFTFLEIGPEGAGILAGRPHPFGGARVLRPGDPLEIAGRCIVFSNELFDAQPFRRLVFRAGGWREIWVACQGRGLAEVERPAAELPPGLSGLAPPEGYRLDAPTGAGALLGRIAAGDWRGLFLAFDYGRRWSELAQDLPAGTARAYFRHRQEADLLARPGEQDLTCHLCWDWLEQGLSAAGFGPPVLESQEAFFVARAGGRLAAIVQAEAGRHGPRKSALLQLIHPAHFGQVFQVLHAARW